MKALTLAEAMHYLEKRNIKRNIWDLKQDILRGKLHAQKSDDYLWLTEDDLNSTYALPITKLEGKEYVELRRQGWSKEEIFQKRLLPYFNNEKKAKRSLRAFETYLSRETHKKHEEKYPDLQKHFSLLGERDDLVKKLVEKQSLGLGEEAKDIEEQLKKKETILCPVVREYQDRLSMQLPITLEKQREPGLYASLFKLLTDYTLQKNLTERGVSFAISSQEGFVTLSYTGKEQQIINTLNEHLFARQPEGFPEARLEVKIYIPPQLLHTTELNSDLSHQSPLQSATHSKILPANLVRNLFNLGQHPQALGGAVNSGKIRPLKKDGKNIMKDGQRLYEILRLPRSKNVH